MQVRVSRQFKDISLDKIGALVQWYVTQATKAGVPLDTSLDAFTLTVNWDLQDPPVASVPQQPAASADEWPDWSAPW